MLSRSVIDRREHGSLPSPTVLQSRSLSLGHWLLIAALIVCVAIALALAFEPTLSNWYTIQFICPSVEQRFGFELRDVVIQPDWPAEPVITRVTPGAPMDLAGIRPGDVPVGFVHGVRAGLCNHLAAGLETGSTTIDVVPMQQLNSRQEAKRVVINVQKPQQRR